MIPFLRSSHSPDLDVVGLFHLIHTIRIHLEMDHLTEALCMNVWNVFDSLNHQSLTSKLLCYDIEKIDLKWILDFLPNRSQIFSFKEESQEKKRSCSECHRGRF